jgi:hypothetical protein
VNRIAVNKKMAATKRCTYGPSALLDSNRVTAKTDAQTTAYTENICRHDARALAIAPELQRQAALAKKQAKPTLRSPRRDGKHR